MVCSPSEMLSDAGSAAESGLSSLAAEEPDSSPFITA